MPRIGAVWRLMRIPLAVAAVLGTQVRRAAHRPDLPSHTDQDPSGSFGDPSLPHLRMVFLGDSTVTSPGVEPLDESWVRRIGRRLGRTYHVQVSSVAVGGSRAGDVLTDQVDRAIALQPDIVYVSVGSNDAMRGTTVRRFERAYDEIVDRLAAEVPAVALAGVGDLGNIPRFPTLLQGITRVRSRMFDRAITRVAERHPEVIRSQAWGPMWEPFRTDREIWAEDLFHASGKGHALYAAAAIPVVERLLATTYRIPDQRGSGGSSR